MVKVTLQFKDGPQTFRVSEAQAITLAAVLEIFRGCESDDPFEITGVTRVYTENTTLKAHEQDTFVEGS